MDIAAEKLLSTVLRHMKGIIAAIETWMKEKKA